MYLLPVKTEMDFRDKREKIKFGNNRFITISVDVRIFLLEISRDIYLCIFNLAILMLAMIVLLHLKLEYFICSRHLLRVKF